MVSHHFKPRNMAEFRQKPLQIAASFEKKAADYSQNHYMTKRSSCHVEGPHGGHPTVIKSHQPTKHVFKKQTTFIPFKSVLSDLLSFLHPLSYFKVHVGSKARDFRFYPRPIENQKEPFTGMKIGGRK